MNITNESTQAQINTSDSMAVMAFRMGAVERDVKEVLKKFDSVAQFYVTNATLVLMLDPVKERLTELENIEKERDKKKSSEQAQFKLAMTMAVLSPVFTIIISVLFQQGK